MWPFHASFERRGDESLRSGLLGLCQPIEEDYRGRFIRGLEKLTRKEERETAPRCVKCLAEGLPRDFPPVDCGSTSQPAQFGIH